MLDKWQIIHKYRRAVARGIAPAIMCDYDGVELVPVVGHEDEPALKCLVCTSVRHLGIADLEKMERFI